jgi:phosphoglycolate phosphatase-like HAD superfamily hydrolase
MKLFVWDLHGTLEQGNEVAVVEITNMILRDFGYSVRLSASLCQQLYGLRWYEYFERLLPDEPGDQHLKLQTAAFGLANSPPGSRIIARYIRPADSAIDVLGSIDAAGHQQIVISNTTPASLPIFLEALGMEQFFCPGRALAANNHMQERGTTKTEVLSEYMSGRDFSGIVIIGDSDSDMLLAEDCCAKSYLYAHSGSLFRSDRGHYKINDLRELLNEV